MRLKPAAAVAALALLTACGGNPAGSTGDSISPSASPTTSPSASQSPTRSTGPATRPATGPQRIVSLSPTATETLFAVGAGRQVVAVDKDSDYPAGVPKTQLSGTQPNVEAIAAYNPDLVVVADDTGNLTAQLGKLSIPVVVQPAAATLADAYGEILALGAKAGHRAQATRLVSSMRRQIASLVKGLPRRSTSLTYYHELDNTLYTATSATFIGRLYALAGLHDIADAASHGGNTYPQLSAEYVVRADPDLVFLADTKCCQQSASTFANRPGFGKLTAVRDGHVIPLDDDVASRWGPRIVDFLRRIIAVVTSIPNR